MTSLYKACVFTALTLLFLGCSKEEMASGTPAVKTAAAAVAAKPMGKLEDIVPIVAVTDHLKKIVAGCTVNVENGQAYSCKNKEDSALREWVRKEAPANLFENLAEIALGKDEKLGAAAVAEMDSLFTVKGDDWKKKNATPAAVQRLFKYVKTQSGYKAAKMAKYATHLAFMTGREKELFPLIDGHKTDQVRHLAYENYMTYGRLKGFKELQRITEGTKDEKIIRAALKAPRNMRKDTEQEKAAYCPWAAPYLTDKSLDVAAGAGYVMVKCGGEYIDKLLSEGEARVKAGEFKRPFSQVFREPCFSFIKNVVKKAANQQQCERVFAFLQAVADNDKVDSKIRALSLWNIYYQRRDQKSLDLMRKYEKNKDPEIQKRAKDAIKSLTTTYKLK